MVLYADVGRGREVCGRGAEYVGEQGGCGEACGKKWQTRFRIEVGLLQREGVTPSFFQLFIHLFIFGDEEQVDRDNPTDVSMEYSVPRIHCDLC